MPHNANGNLGLVPPQLVIEVPDSDLTPDQGYFFKTISRFYSKQDLFPHPPEISDVQQVGIGDCFLLAALHGILQCNPLRIEDMMRDEREGWVIVRLYTETNQPVYYRLEKTYLRKDTGVLSSEAPQAHRAFWVYMLEKAYAVFRLKVEKWQITPKKWVIDPVTKRYTQQDEPKRPARTYLEALTGGFSENALQTLLGGAKFRHQIQADGQGSRALGTINFSIATRPGAIRLASEIEALDSIFPGEPQAADNFVSHFGVMKVIAFPEVYVGGKTARRERVSAFFDTHYAGLLPWTRLLVNAFVDDNFPGKRGTGLYTPYQIQLYKSVKQALVAGNYVAMGSGTNLGRSHGQIALTHERQVKGLAGPHAYHIYGVVKMQNPALRFFKARNPWLHYVRDYNWKTIVRADEEVRVLSAMEHQQLNQQRNVTAPLGNYSNGEFLIELSDVTKRFRHLMIGTDQTKALANLTALQAFD
jgi:hypothetical protein